MLAVCKQLQVPELILCYEDVRVLLMLLKTQGFEGLERAQKSGKTQKYHFEAGRNGPELCPVGEFANVLTTKGISD